MVPETLRDEGETSSNNEAPQIESGFQSRHPSHCGVVVSGCRAVLVS